MAETVLAFIISAIAKIKEIHDGVQHLSVSAKALLERCLGFEVHILALKNSATTVPKNSLFLNKLLSVLQECIDICDKFAKQVCMLIMRHYNY